MKSLLLMIAFIVASSTSFAGEVRCAAECRDGSDVHGIYSSGIAGILALTNQCRDRGGLVEGSLDCSDE